MTNSSSRNLGRRQHDEHQPATTERHTMTPETLTTAAQILSSIVQILPYIALAPSTRHLPQAITRVIKALKALHNLVSTPRGRHRQGRARHTK